MKGRVEERNLLERKIISCLLVDIELLESLDIPADKFSKDNKELLEIMKESQTNDPVILASKSQNIDIEQIRELATEVLGTSEFENYVQQLKDVIARDSLIYNMNKMVANLKDWADLSQIYSELNKLKIDVETKTDLSEVLFEIVQEIDWTNEVKIIPTWYRDLDNLIWGFEQWQVIVIGARPWVWKSMFAINMIAKNIQSWEKTALFSLEMKSKQVLRRLLAMNSGVWVRKLKKKVEWDSLSKVHDGFNKLSEQMDKFYCIDNLHTIGEIERKIRYLVHKEWVTMVYLDYLQLIRNPDVKNNPIEALSDMSQRLKQLALQLDITIVELSQLNRESDKSAIKRASQLRWSWSIEQDADMVRILDKLDEEWSKIQVSVQKCRDWRIGDIELLQHSDIMLIQDLPKPF